VYIYSIVNIKGGSSKSTTAVHLVAYLAAQGFSTALVDSDRQMSAAKWVEKASPSTHIFASDIIEDIEDNLDELEAQYKAIVVDTAGSAEDIMMMVIGRSHHVILPVCPSELDIDSAKATIKQIIRARKRYKRDISATAFLSKVVKNTTMQKSTNDLFAEYEGVNFSDVEIPMTQRIIKLSKTENTAFTAPGSKDLAKLYTQLFAPLIEG